MKALVITGSRFGIDLSDEGIEVFLNEQIPEDVELIIHGNAEGVDSIVDKYARNKQIQVLKMPALWETHGKSAGPKRNVQMIALASCLQNCGWEIVCLAIPGPNSKGTYNCLKLMKKAGFHGKVCHVGK